MSNQIGVFAFVKWQGPPPQLVSQHLEIFRKTGQPGISALALGASGRAFNVDLTAVFPTQDLGQIAENGYRLLVGSDPQIIVFNSINYFVAYGHTYLVTQVETTSFSRHPLLAGIGYSYYGGWRLMSRWSLVPVVST